MNETMLNIGLGVLCTVAGFFICFFVLRGRNLFSFEKKQEEAEKIINKSKEKAENITKETNERAKKLKDNIQKEREKREHRISKLEESLKQKEKNIQKKQNRNNEIKLQAASLEEETQSRKNNIKRLEKEFLEKLSGKTGTDIDELKKEIIKRYEKELKEENADRLASIEETVKENSVKTAKKVLINAIQRLCSPTSVESRAVLVKVPKDHIKGKIVGREGKNVKELENTLEVDIIFNDLPNTISISAFNLVNRRIAERTIKNLIKTRKGITPELVKKEIKKAEKIVDEELYKIGKEAVTKMGTSIKDKDLIRTIGRLQFRTSYGQNIMKHSMEVAWVATMLGSELGLNTKVCRAAGFLHDLGKAIDQNPDVQGAHDFLTKELMEKYGFSEEEVHAAWTHHESEAPGTAEALIVKAADAVSAGRPGARQESLEKYLERLHALEETAKSFEGVNNSYAISAGREIRVIVEPEKIEDKEIKPLAKEVAQKIEKKLSYPGKIRVNVIRRTKHIEIAK